MRVLCLFCLLIASLSASAAGSARVDIDHWLLTEPAKVTTPAFAGAEVADLSSLLALSTVDISRWRPRSDSRDKGMTESSGTWKDFSGNRLEWRGQESPELIWVASYLRATRRLTVTLNLQSSGAAEVYFAGKLLSTADFEKEQSYHLKKELHLRRGSHLLLIKCVSTGNAHLEAWLDTDPVMSEAVTASTDPKFAPADFADSGLMDDLASPVISPDGARVAFIQSHRDPSGKKESWLEVRDAVKGSCQLTIRADGVGNPSFLPKSDALIFTAKEDGKTTLWRYDLKTGEQTRIARGAKGLAKYVISPNGQRIYYSADVEEEKQEPDYALIDELTDRMSDWTSHRQLFAVDVAGGMSTELTTTGDFALDEFALSREGDRLLFTRRVPRVERPYFTTEFWTYEVKSGITELIIAQPIAFETAPANLTWLPGGRYVAYTSCAFLTDGNDGGNHSLSETDLWLLDLQDKTTRNLSGNSPWSVSEDEGSLLYNPSDKRLYLAVIRGTQRLLMRCNPLAAVPQFSEVKTPLPFVDEFRLSADGRRIVFTGSGPTTPEALYRYDLPTGRAALVFNPHAEILRDLQLATVEPWNFVNQEGLTIEGRLFYPADFDSTRKWPLVVYYYAGVSPRDDRFTFTYHWWCANGYLVYVLNPVGAVGYGQEFADKHVNDWGTLATRDIIEGTDRLLKAKPFLDERRLAAYGGSYGGFITLDLATKTDKFAALCSMSGISNITSYFGGGQWGFTYGDIALARSFPWNRRDVFVDKSPVFKADQVKTPLLLTHGSDDVNVPALESDQMFVALKLLGKEVALVRFKGEDHGFTKWSNRVAEREVMLEWFDKHLKKEPEGWNRRWQK